MGYRLVRLDPRITPGQEESGFTDPENPEKPENRKKYHVTYQIKALVKLVDIDKTKIRISGFQSQKIQKTGKQHLYKNA